MPCEMPSPAQWYHNQDNCCLHKRKYTACRFLKSLPFVILASIAPTPMVAIGALWASAEGQVSEIQDNRYTHIRYHLHEGMTLGCFVAAGFSLAQRDWGGAIRDVAEAGANSLLAYSVHRKLKEARAAQEEAQKHPWGEGQPLDAARDSEAWKQAQMARIGRELAQNETS